MPADRPACCRGRAVAGFADAVRRHEVIAAIESSAITGEPVKV